MFSNKTKPRPSFVSIYLRFIFPHRRVFEAICVVDWCSTHPFLFQNDSSSGLSILLLYIHCWQIQICFLFCLCFLVEAVSLQDFMALASLACFVFYLAHLFIMVIRSNRITQPGMKKQFHPFKMMSFAFGLFSASSALAFFSTDCSGWAGASIIQGC